MNILKKLKYKVWKLKDLEGYGVDLFTEQNQRLGTWSIGQEKYDSILSGNATYIGWTPPLAWLGLSEYGKDYVGEDYADEERYFYVYKQSAFECEAHLAEDEVQMIIESMSGLRQERIRNEVERMKALYSGESSTRQPIPEDVQVFVWNRDGGRCVKCGSQTNLEFDHIIPLSKGGNNTARNIQLLCEKCNRSKGGNIG